MLPGVAVGIGAALVTQLVVMGVISMMGALAKAAIRGGFHGDPQARRGDIRSPE
jgi:hypothetical protein